MSTAATQPVLSPDEKTQQPWLWNVILLDDDEHSYEYVIMIAQELFSHTLERAYQIAKTVDSEGRAVLKTTHRELAELKREQVIAFGRDLLVSSSTGPMRVVLEPAECEADDDASQG